MSSPGDRLDRAPPLVQTGSGAGPVGAGDPPATPGIGAAHGLHRPILLAVAREGPTLR